MEILLYFFVACVAIFIIFHGYNRLIAYPRYKLQLKEALEIKEQEIVQMIVSENKQIANLMETSENPLKRKLLNNLIDNHYRVVMENLYYSCLSELSLRKDIGRAYVQANYNLILEKLEKIKEIHPLIVLDLSADYSENCITAYKNFSNAVKKVKQSDYSERSGKPYAFPILSFGAVSVGNIEIPSFQAMNSNTIYIFPSFFIIHKGIADIEIRPINDFQLIVTESKENWYFRNDPQPKDSTRVGSFYQYAKKDGSPDLRYNYNPAFPIFAFAHLYIIPLKETFIVSNKNAAWLMNQSLLMLKTIASDSLSAINQQTAIHSQNHKQIDSRTTEKKKVKHYVGEKHPTKPWVWIEYAPGRFDWRKDKSAPNTNIITACSPKIQPEPSRTSYQALDELIGLESVKEEVTKLTNFIKIQQVRHKNGLKTSPISYHCVFTGNPGTGKTTVARIIADIYHQLGILATGNLIEADRSDLVAEYVGQTAVKTNKIIDSALDGVLFIDEAYSLFTGSSNDFGLEAIATLLKRMEDDRNRLVIILAGYSNEMKAFIDSNPGLHSRFNRYIHFEDYSSDALFDIFMLNARKGDYILTDAAKETLKEKINAAVANKDKNFGNARFIRNLFEKVLEHQATRLSTLTYLDKNKLQTIDIEDIQSLS